MPHAVEGHFCPRVLTACSFRPIRNGEMVSPPSYRLKASARTARSRSIWKCCSASMPKPYGHHAAVELALRALSVMPRTTFSKGRRVVFRIAFETDSRMMPSAPSEIISVADTTFTPFFFKRGLVAGAVIAVSRANLSSFRRNRYVKQPLAAVVIMLWNSGRLSVFAEYARSMLMPQYRDTVFLGKGGTLAELTFNAFFSLAVRGIAGVDHGFHFVSTSEHLQALPSIVRS